MSGAPRPDEPLFPHKDEFPSRHIGPRDRDIITMLDLLGFKVKTKGVNNFFLIGILINVKQSLDELTDKAVPKSIRLDRKLDVEEPVGEAINN